MTEHEFDEPKPFGGLPLPRLALHIARRGALWIGVCTMIGAAGGLFFGVVQPNTFSSVGTLRVQPGLRESMSPEVTMFGEGPQNIRAGASVSSAFYAIWNERLWRKIVEKVGIEDLLTPADPRALDDENTPLHERWLHEAQAWWRFAKPGAEADGTPSVDEIARQLSQHLSITPIRDAPLLSVSFETTSPVLAQRVVAATLEAAVEVYQDTFSRAEETAKLRAELEVEREVEDAAERALRAFEAEHAIRDFAGERAQLRADLDERARELDRTRIELQESLVAQTQLDRLLRGSPNAQDGEAVPENPNSAVPAIPNPEYTELRAYIRDLERRLFELELSPEIATTRKNEMRDTIVAEIKASEEDLSQLHQTLPSDMVSALDPRKAALQTNLDEVAVAIGKLERRRDELTTLLDRDQARLAKLNAVAPRHRELEAQLEHARERVRRLSDSEADFEDLERIDRMQLSNLVPQGATFQPDKVGPQRGKLLAIGLLLGAVVGMGFAVLRFVVKGQVRDPEDAILLGAPFHGRLSRQRGEPLQLPLGTSALAGHEVQVAQVWSRIPLDRVSGRGLSIGFLRDVPGDRLSSAAASFAMGLALHGQEPVVLVCADPSGSWLLRRIRAHPAHGWSDVVAGKVGLDAALVDPGIGRLTVAALGDSADGGIASAGSRKLIEQLTGEGRYVVVELPPLTRDPMARAALSMLDACEVVLTRGRSVRTTARETLDAARESGATLMGALLEDNLPKRVDHVHERDTSSVGARPAAPRMATSGKPAAAQAGTRSES